MHRVRRLRPLPETGTGSYAECEAWLQRLPAPLQGRSPEDLLADSGLFDSAPPALAHALETALLDLQARLLGEPLHRLLAPHAKRRIPVNAMIGALDEEASERAIAAQQAGFTTIKIKIGMRSPDRTLQQLRALSARLTPGTRLRLDANRAWRSVDDVHRFLHGLADLPVEYVEEPLRTPRLETLQTLQRDTPVPLALDESLGDLSPAAVFDTLPGVCLILKPMCLGGLRPTLALARQARARREDSLHQHGRERGRNLEHGATGGLPGTRERTARPGTGHQPLADCRSRPTTPYPPRLDYTVRGSRQWFCAPG